MTVIGGECRQNEPNLSLLMLAEKKKKKGFLTVRELQSAVASFELHRLDCRLGGLPDTGHCSEGFFFFLSF